ncbi:hypothetical protein KVV02_007861 [Mortierella alpina]|uniref:C3H1-type domain-containing protein n=1 Tax=Mortierella alpina TaxID=64518 RepID=A0A9P8A700_MORAP|nr:hypothetical protein KVV02_007861 [Mortierella alpina]
MRFSTAASLVALSSLGLLITPSFHSNGLASAALTPEERIQVEAKDPENPNYCPACLKKAMINHFPHACPKDLEPMEATTRPEGPRPDEQRCVCVSFMDLYWMKLDCAQECTFVHDAEAMKHFLPSSSIPGCDKWVDFVSGEEKEVEGFEKKDTQYKPEVFTKDRDSEHGASEASEPSETKVEEHVVEEGIAKEPTVEQVKMAETDELRNEGAEYEVKDEL